MLSSLIIGCSGSSDNATTDTNTLPIADAGSDKLFVTVDDNKIMEINSTEKTVLTVNKISDLAIQLDGSLSLDNENDPLSYQWRITQKPQNSITSLRGESTSTPTLSIDRLGDYTLELIVNDGKTDSIADEMTISVKTYVLDKVRHMNPNDPTNAYTYLYDMTYDNEYKYIIKIHTEFESNSSIYSNTFFTYDTYGNMSTREYNSSTGEWEENSWDYDEKGQLLASHDASSDGWYEDIQNVYDNDGKLIESNLTSQNLLFPWNITYVYDTQDNLVTIDRDVGDGNRWISEFEYDENGTKIKGYRVASSVESTTSYTYDERGNIIEEYTVQADNSGWYKQEYTYNEVNEILTDRYENSFGNLELITYTYDTENRVLTRQEEDQNSDWMMRSYTYDEFGKESTTLYESSQADNSVLVEFDYKLIPE